jgi:hypothetical protein
MPVGGTHVACTGSDIAQALTASLMFVVPLAAFKHRPKKAIGPGTCGQGPTASIPGRATCSNDASSIIYMKDVSAGD